MSRSRKKTPRAGDQKDKTFKKLANKRIRQLPLDEPSLNYKAYRKKTCSWLICDYQTVGTSFHEYWKSLVKSWHRWGKQYGRPYPDYEQAYKDYCRWFIRK